MEKECTLGNRTFGFNKRSLLAVLVYSIFFFTMMTSNVLAADSVAQIYDSTYDQDGNNAAITMNFDSNAIVQDSFTHSTVTDNSRLYVNETGTFKISYSCAWEATAGPNNRRIYENLLRINGVTDHVPSESDVYIRGDDTGAQAGGYVSSTSATVLVNLTNGDYVELRGGEDSGDSNNGATLTTEECFMTAQKLNTRAIKVYDSTGGQSISTIGDSVVVNLDNLYYNGDTGLFSLNADQVTVNEDGWYRASYTSCLEQITGGGGNQRESPQSWIRKNANENISLSFSFAGYTRRAGGGGDKNCNRANTLINLTSGDFLELQTGIFDSENDNQMDLIQDQSWLILEKVELDSSIISINNSGQQIDHGGPIAINFDLNDKLENHVTHTGSSSRVFFNKAGLYEISYNIGYQDGASGDRVITCGNLRKNGNENVTPSKQCIYTRGDNDARTGTVSTTSIVNVSKDDYVEIMIEVEGEVGTDELVQIQKGTTWFTVIKINETPTIRWDSNLLDLGDGNLSQGNLTSSVNVSYTGEGQDNLKLTCLSGDCSKITGDFVDGTNINTTKVYDTITFTCDDSAVGSYSTNFNINSTQDPSGDNLSVTCDINQTFGSVNIVLDNPLENSFTNVIQNSTFNFNTTLICEGDINSTCGNISINSRYNDSSSTFANIPLVSSNPTWAILGSQPQSCALDNGENCSLSWIVNMSGNIGEEVIFNVNTSSNFTQVQNNISSNFTINITVLPPNTITWDTAILNMGSGGLNLGNITGTAKLQVSGNHTGINTTCTSGDCNLLSDNWLNGGAINDSNEELVTFTCDDSNVGIYSAVFDVNSTQDTSPKSINVSCEITQTYGTLNITTLYPPENTNTIVNALSIFDINTTVVCEGTLGASCENVSLTPRYVDSTLDYGDGSDGELIVSSLNTVINNYTYLTGNENSAQPNITVGDSTEFSIGDEILIIQIQDGLGTGLAGNYEFGIIIGKNGNELTLENNLTNTYGSGTFNSISSSATQVIRVPQYTNVTIQAGTSITAPAWNGTSGGIVVLRSQEFINSTGYINVSEKGFRGGDCNGCGNNVFGDQGEGTSGIGTTSTGANGQGGGGGDGTAGNGAPGGGGGYGTSGNGGSDDSGSDSFGGNVKGFANLDSMFFGGGAGAGGDDNGGNPENVDGGGIAVVYSKIIRNANVHSVGEKGILGNNGVSGSGAGGTIWLAGNSINVVDVNASGGIAVSGTNGDLGGSGGDGRIRFDYLVRSGNSTYPTEGFTTSSTFIETQIEIDNITDSLPFQIVGDKTLYCPSIIYVGGASCEVSWDVNVSSTDEIDYRIDVNGTSSFGSIPDNSSGFSNVTVSNDVLVVINSPSNNSQFFFGGNITTKITSNLGLVYAAYYLDGNVSEQVPMNPLDSNNKTWGINISLLGEGNYNITFLYNESISEQNSTGTRYFSVIPREQHKKITKVISSQGTNIYSINIFVENMLNETEDLVVLDFVDDEQSTGFFNVVQDFINTTFGPNYFGDIYGWNLTVSSLSTTQINYSITDNGGGDFNLGDNFMIGLE